MTKTPIEVLEQVSRATETIRQLPPVAIKNRFCAWPDVIQTFGDMIGAEVSRMRYKPLLRPTAKQLAEMDEVIIWLTWLPAEISRAIWARAEGYSWRKIAAMIGISDKTCRAYAMAGVITISDKVNNKRVKVARFKQSVLRKKKIPNIPQL